MKSFMSRRRVSDVGRNTNESKEPKKHPNTATQRTRNLPNEHPIPRVKVDYKKPPPRFLERRKRCKV